MCLNINILILFGLILCIVVLVQIKNNLLCDVLTSIESLESIESTPIKQKQTTFISGGGPPQKQYTQKNLNPQQHNLPRQSVKQVQIINTMSVFPPERIF